LLDDGAALVEHLVDLLGLLAAGFSEVGASAASATDNRSDFFHDLTSLHAADQIGRHGTTICTFPS